MILSKTIDRRALMAHSAASLAAAALPRGAGAEAAATLRVASVKHGSLGWLLKTIKAEGLDARHGVAIEVVEVATNQAGPVALLSGDADVIVSDWTWALRQRGLGEKVKFSPFTSALGALMVPADSAVKSAADLKGKKIGVAGTAIDKSWILFRAYCAKVHGFDVAKDTTPVYGAAPLMTEELKNGRLDAVLNFWPFAARLAGAGYRRIVSMDEVVKALGVAPTPAFVGFIWKEQTGEAKSAALKGFLAAARAGNAVLKDDDAAWERVRELVRPSSDAELAAIRDYYRSGVPAPWGAADTAAAQKLTALLLEHGAQDILGPGTRFDDALFHNGA